MGASSRSCPRLSAVRHSGVASTEYDVRSKLGSDLLLQSRLHIDPCENAELTLEAPAVVSGFDDVAVMSEAVEQRGGHLAVRCERRHGSA